MILDYQNRFSDAQAVTSTASSTYYIDTQVAGNAIAPGTSVYINISKAFTTGDGGTIICTLDTSTSSDGSTGKVTLLTAPTLTIVTGAAGSAAGTVLLRAVVPVGCLRYLFITYTVANTPAAGTIDAGLVQDGEILIDGQ
jgi:hypothetical protein